MREDLFPCFKSSSMKDPPYKMLGFP
jgi:hypothetical protein